MTKMIHNLIRFGKRQIHTIVSSQIIKPSSPTPSSLKTYNLSVLDQFCERSYIPIVTFYPNTGVYGKTLDLKKTLSETLTKYYPFAGRFDKTKPAYVYCNDDGVEFLEASVDRTLSDFFQNAQHEDMDEFFPHNLVWSKTNFRSHESEKLIIPLAVQVNHFECGGVAVAASLSHKIGDASSLLHFLTDWAKMTRSCSTSNPEFLSFPNIDLNIDGFSVERSNDCVTRSFTFPNSKINSLKLKVKAMSEESGQPITNNLTRTEVLNWLLFKCAVNAATKNKSNSAGSFEPAIAHHAINIRGKMLEPLPSKTVGNFSMIMKILANSESDMKPESFIRELKKQKVQFQSLKNIETAFVGLNEMFSVSAEQEQPAKIEKSYLCSSLSGYSLYDINFGWGKPVKASLAGIAGTNSFIFIDTPNQDGIEAVVCLLRQDMAIFQNDPELLAFS